MHGEGEAPAEPCDSRNVACETRLSRSFALPRELTQNNRTGPTTVYCKLSTSSPAALPAN